MVSETMAPTSTLTSASSSADRSPLPASADAALPRSVSTPNQLPAQVSLAFMASEQVENFPSIHGLTGRSPVMRRLIQQMQRMAPHLTLATIEGEDGTGRNLAARALHAAGPAAQGPFVPCLATQFFRQTDVAAAEITNGHLWSDSDLRQAHGGMLFLDRVHQLSPAQQKMLADFLHWFDDRHVRSRRYSSAETGAGEQPFNQTALPTQIVFSSSVPLRNPGSVSGFREDLASRLCSVRFRLPPLTERREDIPLLAQIFVQRFARAYSKPVRGLGPGTIAPLLRHPWPGNVRELEETITAAALETESQWIRPIDLPTLAKGARHSLPDGSLETADADFNLDLAIRNHVTRILARTRGNKLRAAQLLGISRSTLYRILAAQSSPQPSEGCPSENTATV
jgi:DNA-binding NtrC family response regulator